MDIDAATYGPDHPDVALSLSNLATVLYALDEPGAALPLLERALNINEATHGPNHPVVATCLSNLSTLHLALGKPTVARPLVERALAIQEAAYGPDHPTVAIRLSNLGAVSEPVAALPLIQRAVRIAEATYGSDHPTVAKFLANWQRCTEPWISLLPPSLSWSVLSARWRRCTHPITQSSGPFARRSFLPFIDWPRSVGDRGAGSCTRPCPTVPRALPTRRRALAHRREPPPPRRRRPPRLRLRERNLNYAEAASRFDTLDLPRAAAAARVFLVPLLLQFGHVAQAAPHVAWLRANRARAELGSEDHADIEEVLRLAEADQETKT